MLKVRIAIAAWFVLAALPAGAQTVVWDEAISAHIVVNGVDYARDTFPTRVLRDPANRLFVSGYYRGPTAIMDDNEEFITVRISPVDGSAMWTSVYNPPLPDGAMDAAVDANGDIVVAGQTTDADGTWGMMTLKYARDTGAQVWGKSYRGSGKGDDYVSVVATDAATNVFVGGRIYVANVGTMAKTIKYASSDGAILWETANDASGHVNAIAVDPAGDLLEAVGAWYVDPSGTSRDSARVTKYAGATGEVRWRASTAEVEAPVLALDRSGNVISAGGARAPLSCTANLRVIKYAKTSGSVLWDVTLPEPINAYRIFLKVDAQGDIAVATEIQETTTTATGACDTTRSGMEALKLSGVDGRLLWRSEYGVAAGNIPGMSTMAIDAAGSVFVGASPRAAWSLPSSGKVLKYSGADGRLLWDYTLPPPTSGASSDVYDLALGVGEVYVLGNLPGTPGGYDRPIRLTKLAETDADLRIASYSAPPAGGTGKDLAYAVIVANDGPRTATGVTLAHAMPAGAGFVWATPGCAPAGSSVVCSLADLAPGQTASVTIVVRPTSAGSADATVGVSAMQPDLTPANNGASSSVAIQATPPGVPVPRYRLYSNASKEHHFTTDLNEYTVLGASGAWVQEGTVGKVLDNPGSFNGVTATPYYRLYNTFILWHHWTTDPNEYYTLVTYPGWNGEGVDGYLLPGPTIGAMQLYRLTYPFLGGLHHWTVDANEYDTLVSTYGWVGEGGSGFVIE